MYKQAALPNYDIPYTGGLCQKYVENTVGKSGIYSSATAAWNDNYKGGNHAKLPPKGLRTAAYFSLGNNTNGHTAIQLEDGRVASSSLPGYNKKPYIYPNLQAMIDDYAKYNGGCTYLGWTEYIGKVRVISKGEDMENWDLSTFRTQWAMVLGRNGVYSTNNALNGDSDKEFYEYWSKQQLNNATIASIYNTDEAKAFRNWMDTTVKTAINRPTEYEPAGELYRKKK